MEKKLYIVLLFLLLNSLTFVCAQEEPGVGGEGGGEVPTVVKPEPEPNPTTRDDINPSIPIVNPTESTTITIPNTIPDVGEPTQSSDTPPPKSPVQPPEEGTSIIQTTLDESNFSLITKNITELPTTPPVQQVATPPKSQQTINKSYPQSQVEDYNNPYGNVLQYYNNYPVYATIPASGPYSNNQVQNYNEGNEQYYSKKLSTDSSSLKGKTALKNKPSGEVTSKPFKIRKEDIQNIQRGKKRKAYNENMINKNYEKDECFSEQVNENIYLFNDKKGKIINNSIISPTKPDKNKKKDFINKEFHSEA